MDSPNEAEATAREQQPTICSVTLGIVGTNMTPDTLVDKQVFETTLATADCHAAICLAHGHLNGGTTALGTLLAKEGDLKLCDVLTALNMENLKKHLLLASMIGDLVDDIFGDLLLTQLARRRSFFTTGGRYYRRPENTRATCGNPSCPFCH